MYECRLQEFAKQWKFSWCSEEWPRVWINFHLVAKGRQQWVHTQNIKFGDCRNSLMLVFKVLVGHTIRGDLSPPSSSSLFIQTSIVHYRLSNAEIYVLLFSHPEKIDLEKLCSNGQNVQYILYCIVSHTCLRSVSVDFFVLFCFSQMFSWKNCLWRNTKHGRLWPKRPIFYEVNALSWKLLDNQWCQLSHACVTGGIGSTVCLPPIFSW